MTKEIANKSVLPALPIGEVKMKEGMMYLWIIDKLMHGWIAQHTSFIINKFKKQAQHCRSAYIHK